MLRVIIFKVLTIVIIASLCFAQGCIHIPRSVQIYSGSQQPSEKISKICSSRGVQIQQIDDKNIPIKLSTPINLITMWLLFRFYEEYSILPGYHTVTASYDLTHLKRGDYNLSYKLWIYRRKRYGYTGGKATTSFYAEAGHDYLVMAKFFDNKTKWGPVVTDITTKNGLEKQYYPNGKLESERNWRDSKQEGIAKWYYESGKLQAERNWKDGKQEGIANVYYESGKLEAETNFKDSKRDGIAKSYYESGKLEAETNFKDGKRDGIAKSYYESGKLQAERNWKDGKRDGIAKSYYESGKLQSERNFKDSKQEGIANVYYESGKLEAETNCKDGKRDGIAKSYYESGKLQSEGNFKDGNGSSKSYYENGKLKREKNWKDNKLVSKICYDEQGNKTICDVLNE